MRVQLQRPFFASNQILYDPKYGVVEAFPDDLEGELPSDAVILKETVVAATGRAPRRPGVAAGEPPLDRSTFVEARPLVPKNPQFDPPRPPNPEEPGSNENSTNLVELPEGTHTDGKVEAERVLAEQRKNEAAEAEALANQVRRDDDTAAAKKRVAEDAFDDDEEVATKTAMTKADDKNKPKTTFKL